MYPTLYHFFYDWFGVEIPFLRAVNSFGFFVALAFVAGSVLYAAELKRKLKLGILKATLRKVVKGKPASVADLAINGLIGFILGYKLVHAFIHTEVFNDFPHFLLSKEGNLVAGILLAAGMAYWKYYEKKKEELKPPQTVEEPFYPHQHVGPILFISAVFGILGAKLFAYLEDPGDFIAFISDPFSGLTVYGGLICALIAGAIYFQKNNLPVLHNLDAAAPGLILAYGIGRIGCHVAGDGDWGKVNTNPNPGWLPDWLWAYDYPNNVNKDGVLMPDCIYNDQYCNHLPQPVYPTPIYETIMCLLIFGILWMMRKHIKTAGIMFCTYLIFNGVERFLIEKIRVNKPYEILGMKITQAELISFSFIIIGVAGIIILLRNREKHPPEYHNAEITES